MDQIIKKIILDKKLEKYQKLSRHLQYSGKVGYGW